MSVRVRQGFKTPGYTGENALKAFREPLEPVCPMIAAGFEPAATDRRPISISADFRAEASEITPLHLCL
jgi:hypothetical protein